VEAPPIPQKGMYFIVIITILFYLLRLLWEKRVYALPSIFNTARGGFNPFSM
jgi:hypothetical protein